MVTLIFVITILILQKHLQGSPREMTLKMIIYESTRIDVAKYWGSLYFCCKNFINVYANNLQRFKVDSISPCDKLGPA
jgi:hypothetical protein